MKTEVANRIIVNPLYREKMQKLGELERERIFCKHGIDHSLDVARIALIVCMERGVPAEPDLIYSAALLHDIGRCEEYVSGIPHDVAGLEIAGKILDETGCGENMKAEILELIAGHRAAEGENVLVEIFCTADKKSRLCFCCSAQNECKWQPDKRNINIEV